MARIMGRKQVVTRQKWGAILDTTNQPCGARRISKNDDRQASSVISLNQKIKRR